MLWWCCGGLCVDQQPTELLEELRLLLGSILAALYLRHDKVRISRIDRDGAPRWVSAPSDGLWSDHRASASQFLNRPERYKFWTNDFRPSSGNRLRGTRHTSRKSGVTHCPTPAKIPCPHRPLYQSSNHSGRIPIPIAPSSHSSAAPPSVNGSPPDPRGIRVLFFWIWNCTPAARPTS